jgi:hypothetical protein
MASESDSGDWVEYKRLIIDSIRNLNKDIRGIGKEVKDLRASVDTRLLDMSTQIVGLKAEVKSSARNWGLLAGITATIISSLLVLTLWKLFTT